MELPSHQLLESTKLKTSPSLPDTELPISGQNQKSRSSEPLLINKSTVRAVSSDLSTQPPAMTLALLKRTNSALFRKPSDEIIPKPHGQKQSK